MTPQRDDLATLARIYFGQDWDIVVDTPEQVVDMFIDNRGPAAAARAVDQIDAILYEAPNETSLKHLWQQTLKSSFSVPPTGMTYRQWFEHLRTLLRSAPQPPPATP